MKISLSASRLSWTLLFICACEVTLWFSPILSASSKLVVSQNERAGALVYYTLGQQIGATDAHMMVRQQEQSLALGSKLASIELLHEFQMQRKLAMTQSSSARKSGVSLLGGLALTGGVLLLSYARGSGLAAARDRGGGNSSGSGSNQNGKKKRSANSGAGSSATTAAVAAGTTMAAAAALVARRGVGSSQLSRSAHRTLSALRSTAGSSVRAYSSKRAPFAEAVRVTNSDQQQETCAMDPHARYEVVPPQALKEQPVVDHASLTAESLAAMSDAAIVQLVRDGAIPPHTLEHRLGNLERAVDIRRQLVANGTDVLADLPFQHYDYENVVGACAENVLGYVPVPVGIAGPVMVDNEMVTLPMATTEGCLIASTHRGCKAITESGGATTVLSADGMTRAPSVRFPSAAAAGEAMAWLQVEANVQVLRDAFESTTRFGKLLSVDATQAGRTVYVRFKARTGDAMGMNMISKGVECALQALTTEFPVAEVMALSGNMCTDKKPSAINWINGRGKSVVAEVVLKKDVVERVLKTNVDALVELNISKNLVGSAMAGSIGGFNAHASNIVTAMYIATGQDPAQNVESSNCITLMERDGEDLRVSVTMPSIECASIGGGTHLPPQSAALKLMGCQGANVESPGLNARKFARCVATATLAGEISLMSALCSNDLVRSHMLLNRKKA